jgi:putative tryptophan/tyrosine transport system substrate-binding protein
MFVNGFEQGMRELGYIEGRDFSIASRYADGDVTRMPALAEELLRLQPKVFVTSTDTGTRAIKQETASIPIVHLALNDPISLQPSISKIGVLVNRKNPSNLAFRRNAEAAAASLGISFQPVEVQLPSDLDDAFSTFVSQRVQAVLLPPEVMILSERKRVAALAVAARLPTISSYREFVEAGGLISYGVSLHENWRRSAAYVDKILKGANPGELPLEFPTKLELLINLTTARALGLTVPPTLLAQADEVVE